MTAFRGAQALAQDLLGQPTPKGIALQPAAAPLKHDAIFFHDAILMPIITAITLFVAALLVWVIVRYNRRANPNPASFTHNSPLEVTWTVVPIIILVFIGAFSLPVLFKQQEIPEADVTIKAIGYQWYWGYAYPDQDIPEYVSNMLFENETTPELYRLAVDQPVVAPSGETVRVIVTAADVIHNWAMPSFGIKMDAIPGRLNETWFFVPEGKEGTYYGQCS